MSELISRSNTIIKDNIKIFGWIIVFAIYSYLINDKFIYEVTQSANILFSAIIILLMLLITVFVMLRNISLSESTTLTWGLRLDKQGWFIWSFLAAFTIVYMFFYPPVTTSIGHMVIYSLNLMNLTVQELILRAFLISYLINILGKTKKDILLAVIISSILIAIVQKPFFDLSVSEHFSWGIFVGIFYGYIYFYTKSIIFFMFFSVLMSVGYLLPHTPDSEVIYPVGLALLLYLILSGTCFVFKKLQSRESN